MSGTREYSKVFHIEFIELYKQYKCLWKLTDPDYYNMELKQAAYEQLLKKLIEVDKMANIDCVKKKVFTMRANYYTELKKIQNSVTSSQNTYQPTLWYFYYLNFLQGQESPRTERIINRFYADENILLNDAIMFPPVQSHSSAPVNGCSGCPTIKRKSDSGEEMDLVKISKHDAAKEEDKCDVFGKHIANQLRTMSPTDRIYSQKLISDIVFEVQLGRAPNIHLSSKRLTEHIEPESSAQNNEIS